MTDQSFDTYLSDDFDAEEEPEGSLSIPTGWYNAKILEAEITKSGKGDPMLKLKLEILDTDRAGDWVWDNIMLAHDNPTVIEIAEAKFKHLCQATKLLPKPKHPDDLVYKRVEMKMVRKKAKERDLEYADAEGYQSNATDYRLPGGELEAADVPKLDDNDDIPF